MLYYFQNIFLPPTYHPTGVYEIPLISCTPFLDFLFQFAIISDSELNYKESQLGVHMVVVQCENPKCRRQIAKHSAHVFKDDDYYEHFACGNEVCLTRAIMAIDLKEQEFQTYLNAVENCR
jgi:hypothetical protein